MGFLKISAISTAALATSAAVLTGLNATASAQTCEPLSVVDGTGHEVTKTVSPPGAFLIDTNWNTDFAITNNSTYDYFVINFLPESGESYDIDVHMKYSDGSNDTAYSVREAIFSEGEPVEITAESRVSSTPYQVNLRVGGLNAEGNTYTASVMGCR